MNNNEIVDELNEEQRLPVLATDGAILVTAGAGSGKTRLLTHRIAFLIKEKNVAPENILAITFTNKAANEMRVRVEKIVEDCSGMWIMTFHAMCVRILKQFGHKLGFSRFFSIYGDAEKDKVLKIVLEEMGFSDTDRKKMASWHISNAKNQNLSPDDYLKQNSYSKDIEIYCDIYARYQQKLLDSNALDFDDLLVKTYELLVKDEEARNHYQNKFRYIHIDEFQDTNKVQYEIAKILSGLHRNIFVVGDEDQCIYGWRGANIDNILSFQKDFVGTQVFKLQQNYRSTSNIIALANQVIKNNTQRLDKNLWTQNQEGVKVVCQALNDDAGEADYVVRQILRLKQDFGYKLSDFAILMRLNAMTRAVEEKLLNYNINYKVLGGLKFYDRAEIKNLLAYLRLIVNPKDNESFERIVNFPKRGIGQASVDSLREIATANNMSCLELLFDEFKSSQIPAQLAKKMKPFADLIKDLMLQLGQLPNVDFIAKVVEKTNIRSAYLEDNEENINRLKNIDSFGASAYEYFDANPSDELDDFLQSVTLISDIDSLDDENDAVLLATVHAVKGLEYKVVFVVGLEEGNFPIVRHGANEENEMEEERRLLYVAITRARERLYLTRANSRFMYGKREEQFESRFLREMQGCPALDSYAFAKPKVATSFVSNDYGGGRVNNGGFNFFANFGSSGNDAEKLKALLQDFKVGTKVEHPKFGVGVILEIKQSDTNPIASIDFEDVGVKMLALMIAPLTLL